MIKSTMDGVAELERANKRRDWDKERKRKQRSIEEKVSTGLENPLFLTSNSINKGIPSKEVRAGKSAGGNPPEKKEPKVKAHPLPAEWSPSESNYQTADRLGFTRAEVNGFVGQMRRWTEAEAHRKIVLKSNWSAAFSNWLEKAAERRKNNTRPEKIGFADIARGRVQQ